MARVPIVKREHVPEQFREAFDAVTADSGGVIASGPGSITMILCRNQTAPSAATAPSTGRIQIEVPT
jgi:hypothetical protein